MDFIILGSGSGMPCLSKHHSSVLVKTSEHTYLLDCGDSTSRQLLKQGIGWDDLDAVLITHLHPDHFSGIYMLLQMLYLGGRSKPLHLFLPERQADFEQSLQMLYTFPQKFGFALQIHDLAEVGVQFPEVTGIVNDHLLGYKALIKRQDLPNLMLAYSLLIKSPTGDFVYSSDLKTIDSIFSQARGAHTILVDAGHPNPEQILKLRELGIDRVILTHDPRPELLARIAALGLKVFEEAVEGVPYHI
jgi:ribonuclease BN (tRNA processing enzyme)